MLREAVTLPLENGYRLREAQNGKGRVDTEHLDTFGM